MLCPSIGPKYLKPISSKYIPGIINCFIASLVLLTKLATGLPIIGIPLIIFFHLSLDLLYFFLLLNLVNNSLIPPIFLEILISLSFKITIKLVLDEPAWFRASNAIPPVKAPSPITAITEYFSFFKSLALAIPIAADIDVLLCPVLKQSVGDSLVLGKPAIPFNFLKVLSDSFLPFNIL